MSAKMVFPSALILAVVSCCAARAQLPPGAKNQPEVIKPSPAPVNDPPPAAPDGMPGPAEPPGLVGPAGPGAPGAGPTGLSQWITYGRTDCCGPIGGNGPIKDELYLRTGPSLPVAGPIFGHVLTTGWEVQGGARTLYFNPERDAAWTADISVSSIWNGGQHADRPFPLNVLAQPGANAAVFHAEVLGTLRELNRTAVNLGLGREWYLLGNGNSCACGQRNWRVGIDGGAGYGSESASVAIATPPGILAVANDGTAASINLLMRRSHVFASAFVALHTDYEFSCGCCVYTIGFRAEWAYTWSSLLQLQNDSDMMDVNLLMQFGVRF